MFFTIARFLISELKSISIKKNKFKIYYNPLIRLIYQYTIQSTSKIGRIDRNFESIRLYPNSFDVIENKRANLIILRSYQYV